MPTPEALAAEYHQIRPYVTQYVEKLVGLLKDLTSDANVAVSSVEGRAKDVQSYVEKARRKGYRKPLAETTDLVGLRVVTYYNDDVEKLVELVKREFMVLPEHSADKLQLLDPDEFGYRSWHLVFRLSSPRAELSEWRRFKDIAVEIQLRSVLQHAWAAISHKLDYKLASQAPATLRRELFRLSALLELADEQFAAIRIKAHSVSQGYKADLASGDLEIPLDAESLSQYLHSYLDLDRWRNLGASVGFVPEVHHFSLEEQWNYEVLDLHHTLRVLGLSRIVEVDKYVKAIDERAVSPALARIANESKALGSPIERFPVDTLNMALIVNNRDALPPTFNLRPGKKPAIRRAVRNELSRREA